MIRSSSIIVSSRGTKTKKKNKTKKNSTKQNKKTLQSVPHSNAIQLQKVFQHVGVVRLVSHQRKRDKKRVLRQFCEWLSAAVACLPGAVSLLLLEALFMQISGVSLALTWPPQALFTQSSPGHHATATSFPLSKHTGGGDTAPTYSGWHVCLQFMWEVGLPPSPVEFSSLHRFYKLSRSWLLDVCRHFCLLQLACEGFPLPTLRGSGHPALFAMYLLCCYCLLLSFSFFPVWGWSVQGAVLIWPRVVCGSTTYRLPHLVVHFFPSPLGTAVLWW
jgi:hypothetical protein